MELTTRFTGRDPADPSRQVVMTAPATIDPSRTALVICDMWDRHWCRAAERRVAEVAPAINRLAANLRQRGALIAHAPSDTLSGYLDHPARRNAIAASVARPQRTLGWKGHDPGREGPLPVDDSDGGCPCTPRCADGRPWRGQISAIEIYGGDVLTDSAEIYSVYADRGVDTVLFTGVHTNMCVLGRPFGIRRSVELDYRVLLVRDLTDTMYNPSRRPWVDHFTGTDIVVQHIETWWCSSVTSDQIVGGEPFRFAEDSRT